MSISLLAPSSSTTRQYTAKSGTVYTADANGLILSVAIGDITDLINCGCVPLGQIGAKNNFTATTSPGVSNDNTQDYAIGSSWFNKSSGIEYRATSVATGAANWVVIGSGGPIGFPLVTGRFYPTNLPGATLAAVLTVLGTLTASPFTVDQAATLASINVGITTGQTGGKVRGAFFYDAAGYPGAIVPNTDTGDLTATGTTVATKGSLTTVLGAGNYWFGLIATASSTMPSVTGATAIYGASANAVLGSDSAAHGLAVSGQAATGLAITGQTYPATDMTTSFPTFPASAALALNVTTPTCYYGV